MRGIIGLVVLVILMFSCRRKTDDMTSTTSSAQAPETAPVEAMLKQYYQDMSDRNWQKYRTHFWSNATLTTVWQQPGDSLATVDITTIDDFIKETRRGPDSKPVFEEKMKDSKITVKGNMAEAWVTYDAKFGTPDSLSRWTGTDVFTLLRHHGDWKIVSLVFESDE